MPIGPLLDYTIIFNRLYKHVDGHNNAQTSLHYQIRLGSLCTLSAILKNYIAELRTLVGTPMYADSDVLPSKPLRAITTPSNAVCSKPDVLT